MGPRGATLKHDVSVPIRDLERLVDLAGARVREVLPAVRLVTYGHVGDGNLHYNLSAPEPGGADEDAALLAAERDLTAAVYAVVGELGGSISAEHGLGQLKRAAAAAAKSEVEVDLMRAVKAALDPAGVMNPGKVVG